MKFIASLFLVLGLLASVVSAGGQYSISVSGSGTFTAANGQLKVTSNVYLPANAGGGDRGTLITGDTVGFVQLDVSILQALGVTLKSVSIQNPEAGKNYKFYGSQSSGDKGVELPQNGNGAADLSVLGDDWPKDGNNEYYKYLSIVCEGGDVKIIIIIIIVICEPCQQTTTTQSFPSFPPGGNGDPQFYGLQHQNFQFHGEADEVFSLVSSPEVRVNSLFKYISTGKCDYDDTVCWTHPGTYLDQIGITFGTNKILLQSGPHSNGAKVYVNDKELSVSNKYVALRGNNSTAFLKLESPSVLIFESDVIYMRIVNSDYFFNFDFGIKDQSILVVGAKPVSLNGEICELESRTHLITAVSTNDRLREQRSQFQSMLRQHYPSYPLHGLIGQTWKNVNYCGRYYEGQVDDYITGDLFANPPNFNFFNY